MDTANRTLRRQAIVAALFVSLGLSAAHAQDEDALDATRPAAEGEARPTPSFDTSKLPPQERILEESFPGIFEPMRSEKTWFWSVDLNGDGVEDLVIWAKSKVKMEGAWKRLPIHNPPYEWASRGEIQENPMFDPHYSMRPGESYLVVFHGGPRGWKELSIGASFVLQDVAEVAPETTTFGAEDEEKTHGLKIRYEGKPGLLYFAGDRYVVAMKDE
jgi:hypothetical protein